MKLTERSLTELMAAFQSSDPTPGGGSASALAGAIGASLLAMVATLPKSRAAEDEERLRLEAAALRCRTLAAELTSLVDRDSQAYDLVIAAYRRPKGSAAEKAIRSDAIQEALRTAIAVPLEVMRCCSAAIDEGGAVAALGNPSASSDVQVGVELLTAGLRGARLNVEINLGSIRDAPYAERVRMDIADIEQHASAARAAVAQTAQS